MFIILFPKYEAVYKTILKTPMEHRVCSQNFRKLVRWFWRHFLKKAAQHVCRARLLQNFRMVKLYIMEVAPDVVGKLPTYYCSILDGRTILVLVFTF